MLGCATSVGPETSDASNDYTYPSFTSVCHLDNGMGVECSNFTPDSWAWSWYGVGEHGLETYYCNAAPCISGKQCMVQDDGKLLTGVCE